MRSTLHITINRIKIPSKKTSIIIFSRYEKAILHMCSCWESPLTLSAEYIRSDHRKAEESGLKPSHLRIAKIALWPQKICARTSHGRPIWIVTQCSGEHCVTLKRSNCFRITQLVGQYRTGNNKVNKCKLKKYLFGKKNERKTGEFRYSMTTYSPLVA